MQKVIFWDKSFVFIEDDVAQKVELVMGTSKKFRLLHLANPKGDVLIGTTISRITPAHYREYEHLLPRNDKMIAAPKVPEITDEQRAANIKKFAKMREDFNKRLSAKKEKKSE